jgi:predicted RNase H-like HicB family nuclease
MPDRPLRLNVELEEERESGRWIADVTDLPGVLVYGATAFEALAKAKMLALEVIGDRLAHGEDPLTGCELGDRPPDDGADREEDGSHARRPLTTGTREALTTAPALALARSARHQLTLQVLEVHNECV